MPPPIPLLPWQRTATLCPEGEENYHDRCYPCNPGYFAGKSSERDTGGNQIRVCEPCPGGHVQWQNGSSECIRCPKSGIDCFNQTHLVVLNRYWRPSNDEDPVPYRCPMRKACVGGPYSGDQLCRKGHHGALCGSCDDGFVRFRDKCGACPKGYTEVWVTISIFVLVGMTLIPALMAYLYTSFVADYDYAVYVRPCITALKRRNLTKLASTCSEMLKPQAWQEFSTLLKVVLGFSQLIEVFDRFTNVRWPSIFSDFLRFFSFMYIDFDILRVDCANGTPLTFYQRLPLAMLLPIIGTLFLISLAAMTAAGRSWRSTYYPRSENASGGGGRTDAGLSPAARHGALATEWCQKWAADMLVILKAGPLWTLEIWMCLLLYPMITRWTLAIFDCIPVRDHAILRADPSEVCYSPTWFSWMFLSVLGILVYSLGMPAAACAITQRYRLDRVRRARVRLLQTSYTDDHWWFESCDLLRKLMLAGVIVIIKPNTPFQLWLGSLFSLFSLIMFYKLEPYRFTLSQRVQTAALAQILFNYLAAGVLFYEDPRLLDLREAGGSERSTDEEREEYDEDFVLGVLLIVVNCALFISIEVVACRRSAPSLGGEAARAWCTFCSTSMISSRKAWRQHSIGVRLK